MSLKQKIGIKILLILSILCTHTMYGQTSSTDLAAWNGIEIEYKLDKKWAFDLEVQLRLKENISVIDEYFTQFNTDRI